MNKRKVTFKSINSFLEGRELVFNVFKSGIIPFKPVQGKGIRYEHLKDF